MDAVLLASIAGALLSLIFSYIPGLKTWYATLDTVRQRLIMLAALLIVAGGVMGISCLGWGGYFGVSITCDEAGAAGILKAFIAALIANQATYAISPASSISRKAVITQMPNRENKY